VKNSLFGSLILVGLSTYLILKLSKKAGSDKYKLKPKNRWNALSEGHDPTDD
jgi:hypothetical protein